MRKMTKTLKDDSELSEFEKAFAFTTWSYMQEHGISIKEVADNMDISYPFVWERLKAARRSMTLSIICAIADILHEDPYYLLVDLNKRVKPIYDSRKNLF